MKDAQFHTEWHEDAQVLSTRFTGICDLAQVREAILFSFEPLHVRHVAELYDSLLDERLYRFIPEKPPPSLASLEAQFKDLVAGAPAGSGEIWLNWVIRQQSSQSCVGMLQATSFANGELWVGYKVIPAWWGRGVATLGLAWLLGELALLFPGQSVFASVDTRNLASMRVLGKCGFTFLRQEPAALHDERTEDRIYCLLRGQSRATP